MRRKTSNADAPVLLVNAVGQMGGAEWSLLELARALSQRGLDLQAAVPAGPLAERLTADGITCHALPHTRLHRPRGPGDVLHVWRHWRISRRALHEIVAKVSPRILHANGTTAALLTRRFGSFDGIWRLWHCRDLMHSRSATRACAAGQDAIVAISTPVQARLRALVPRYADRVARIPNGIDLTRFAVARPTRHDNILRVGMIAHLVPWKRHDRFLECLAHLAARLPIVRGMIAGADLYGEHAAWRAALCARMQQSDLAGHAEFADPSRSVPDLLGEWDLLMHPAEGEPFGRVICEAMAAGCPVVAVANAGPAEILTHGHTGWLCPTGPRVTQALFDGAFQLLQDVALRRRIVAAAKTAVRERFDIQRTAADIHALYAKMRCCSDAGL